jgi:hypothetical protein
MSVRRAELARLEAAGWTVLVDSPWRRLAAAAVRWLVRWPVDAHESTDLLASAGPVAGWSGPVGRWSR